MPPMRTLHAACLLILLVAGGCTSLGEWWHNGFKVGPNYQAPPAPVKPQWSVETPQIRREPTELCAWWTALNDPVLNSLIDACYRQNLSLQAAGARVLEARAQRNIAVGNLFPQSQSLNGAYAHA